MSRRFKYGVLVVWPSLWLTIAGAVVGLLTLGYYTPQWDSNFLFWGCQWFQRRFPVALCGDMDCGCFTGEDE